MLNRFVALAAWGSLAFIAFATLSPIGLRPQIGNPALERLAAFVAAGFFFGLAYPRHIILVAILVPGSAIFLEVLQLATADRHARLLDVAFKLTGALTGLAAARIARSTGPGVGN